MTRERRLIKQAQTENDKLKQLFKSLLKYAVKDAVKFYNDNKKIWNKDTKKKYRSFNNIWSAEVYIGEIFGDYFFYSTKQRKKELEKRKTHLLKNKKIPLSIREYITIKTAGNINDNDYRQFLLEYYCNRI